MFCCRSLPLSSVRILWFCSQFQLEIIVTFHTFSGDERGGGSLLAGLGGPLVRVDNVVAIFRNVADVSIDHNNTSVTISTAPARLLSGFRGL